MLTAVGGDEAFVALAFHVYLSVFEHADACSRTAVGAIVLAGFAHIARLAGAKGSSILLDT